MNRSKAASAALVALLAAPFGAVAAQKQNPCADVDTDTARWHFHITPYGWAIGIRGDGGVRERTARVDLSFRDVLRHLDGVFLLPAEAWKGRVGVGAELIYAKLSDEKATAGLRFTGASADVKLFIADLAPRIRVVSTKQAAVDVLFGARLWSLDNTINLHRVSGPDLSDGLNETWVDAFAGARAFYHFTDRWVLQVRGDAGGFGSLLTWQALGLVGYTASSRLTLRAGYRQLDVDFHEGGKGLIFDVGIGGPILGVSIRF